MAKQAESERERRAKVIHAEGEATVKIDQRKRAPIDGLFTAVGTYRFAKGETVTSSMGLKAST